MEHLVGFPMLPPWLGGGQTPHPSASSQAMVSPRRCGRLAFHIQLPYSFLHFPYVESAIRFTHSKDFCGNCSLYPNTTQEVRSRDAGCSRAPFSPLALHIREKNQPYLHVEDRLWVGSHPSPWLRGKVMKGLE